ncbi:hypothetical protein, conserved [Plasmodium gonderi]|uniref:Uncharacterized protein n=1 Tax=Plasmodium gonderi TaxID=77519 RepID=A0A1Y1JMU4_PLAGO|nr:hypothetical protein, conserved [Plasmodium gonderi]GAW81713.1 hypothetical protein, conserved [Plasmodium gonderi]
MKNINNRLFWENTYVNNENYTNSEFLSVPHGGPIKEASTKGKISQVLSKKHTKIASSDITTNLSNTILSNPIVNSTLSCKKPSGEKLNGKKQKWKKFNSPTFNFHTFPNVKKSKAKNYTHFSQKTNIERKNSFEKRESLLKNESIRYHEKTDIENDANDFTNLIIYDDDQTTFNEKLLTQGKLVHETHRNSLTRDNQEILLKDIHFDIHAKIGNLDEQSILKRSNVCMQGFNVIRNNKSKNNRRNINKNCDNFEDSKNSFYSTNFYNNEGKTNCENLNKRENLDTKFLLEHIKRLEYQNNIFLNNLLNMYYVCMDYIKMQDEKIKKNEEIILYQKKIIQNLKENQHLDDTTGMSNDTYHNCKNNDSEF